MNKYTFDVIATAKIKTHYQIKAHNEKQAERIANDILLDDLSIKSAEDMKEISVISKVSSSEKFCPNCGKSFQNKKQGRSAKYCSPRCRTASYRSHDKHELTVTKLYPIDIKKENNYE